MAKPLEVIDEFNVSWLVFPGDPAAEMAKKLAKIMTLIVLPRATIKSGILTETQEPSFDNLTDEMMSIPEVREQVIRQWRMWDIYEYLTDKTGDM